MRPSIILFAFALLQLPACFPEHSLGKLTDSTTQGVDDVSTGGVPGPGTTSGGTSGGTTSTAGTTGSGTTADTDTGTTSTSDPEGTTLPPQECVPPAPICLPFPGGDTDTGGSTTGPETGGNSTADMQTSDGSTAGPETGTGGESSGGSTGAGEDPCDVLEQELLAEAATICDGAVLSPDITPDLRADGCCITFYCPCT